ncbi:MAG: beta-ketoacyl synthase N-terminal-like domain-containing protein [Cystobacter sp.]
MSNRPEAQDIAIIGLAGRFPGANSVEELWKLLVEGREGIATFSTEELEDGYAGLSDTERARYVPRRGAVEGVEQFDSKFFRLSEAEADLLDPQHRMMMEVAWEALESACLAGHTGMNLGVFTASGLSQYLIQNLLADPAVLAQHGPLQLLLFNDKDFLATRLAYFLDVHGPAVNLQTGCSSSLVALHYALASLERGDCEAALVGGVALALPQKAGYVYAENMIGSRDGSCRAFDREASGTVRGNGACAVVLKPLHRARADGDPIWGVIKASAINNDGREKIGFTAPSARWQSEVISSALERSGISAEHLDLVEAHGTGTPLGDPIEAKALREALGRAGAKPGQVRHLGALKTNIGHLDTAAGLAGLIKVCLSLKNEVIPPTLHFREFNPNVDFGATPFVVNTQPVPWPRGERPRCAGLSSFGIGGTNVHVILEEAPAEPRRAASLPGPHVVLVSARSAQSFAGLRTAYQKHLERLGEEDFAHFAHSTRVGRRPFEQRAALVVSDVREAVEALARCEARTSNRTHKTVGLEWIDPAARDAGSGRDLVQGLEARGIPMTQAAGQVVRLRIDAEQVEVVAEGKPVTRVPLTTPRREYEARLAAALWSVGVVIDWSRFAEGQGCRKVALPTYVFDRRRHWIAPQPRQAAAAPAPREAVNPPKSLQEVEVLVLGGWRALLGARELGAKDNVFDAGANSLLVGQFIEQVRTRGGLTLSVTDCYEEPTCAGLAGLIARRVGLLQAPSPAPLARPAPAAAPSPKPSSGSSPAARSDDGESFQDL